MEQRRATESATIEGQRRLRQPPALRPRKPSERTASCRATPCQRSRVQPPTKSVIGIRAHRFNDAAAYSASCELEAIRSGIVTSWMEAIETAWFLNATQKRDIFYNNAARFLRLSDK